MKKIRERKILLIVVAVVMILSLISCGRKNKEVPEKIIDFTSASPDLLKIDNDLRTVILGNNGSNHLAVYTGMNTPTNDFLLEADVRFMDSDDKDLLSAALLFGVEDIRNPTWKYYGANIDTSRLEGNDMFRVFGSGFSTDDGGEIGNIDLTDSLHMKLNIRESGYFVYSFGNSGDKELRSIRGYIPDWGGVM